MMTDNFDKKADGWDENPERHKRASDVASAIKASGLKPVSALEFGCGTGLLTFALRPFADRTVLADTSSGMIDVLTKKINAAGASDLSARLISEGADELAGETFDTIYSLMTLHHINDIPGILSLFNEHLTPGGTLFICDLEEEDGSFHGGGFSGHCGFNRASLTAQLNAAGFTSVAFEVCHTIINEVDEHPTSFPLFLATAKR
ncbi:methyltransferase [Desulfoluna limicola]|uniref:Methyltransferase n=1 Tax=Desulfoluna limicola TaxID=2810562 RepID=A0ABM7PB74_9BACT|nr:class I SAM-dependent methyltransferase [Desulfoluna limicola]BCS94762.1 methyltransferase [Desulfoluna limicola]